MADPKLREQAIRRIQDRSPRGFGVEPSEEDILKEAAAIQQESQESLKEYEQENEVAVDQRSENLKKSKELFGGQIDPKLTDYAYNLFPSLSEIVPRNPTAQAPMVSEEQVEESPEQQEETPKMEKRQPASISPNVSPEQTAERLPAAEMQLEQETEPESENAKLVEEMQANQRRARMAESMARTRDAIIGAGLGRKFETDYEMYKELEKEAAEPVLKVKAVQEMDSAKAKNDPNSAISKFIRGSLSSMYPGLGIQGMEKISYAQLEKLYPSLTNALATKMAADARKEEAAAVRLMKQEVAASKAEEKENAKYEKTRSIVNNKIAKLIDSKTSPFNGYNQAKQTSQMIDNAIEAWDESDRDAKIKNSVAFMQYAKLAQGDDSVVRSSDMQALAGSLDYSSPYALLNKFAAKAEGSSFTRGELVEMKKVVDTIRRVKKQQIQQRLDPIKLDAERGGYDLDQSISPEVIDEIYSPEESANESVKFSKQYKPGSVITLKDGSKYTIQKDGVTGVKK